MFSTIKYKTVLFCIILGILIFQETIYAQINAPIAIKPEVNFSVFHNAIDTSTLYFHLSIKSLLYIKPDSSSKFIGKYSIKCLFYTNTNIKDVVNTLDFNYIDTTQNKKNLFINDSIPFALSSGIYKLKIILTDENRNASIADFIDINKQNEKNNQYFHLTNLEGTTICSNIITQADVYKLSHIDKKIKKFYVNYINNDFTSVDPPFIVNPEDNVIIKIDSSFTLTPNANGFAYLHLNKTGIYHICIDTSKTDGIVLSQYYEDFPDVTTASQLLYPLKYIATKSEYKKLSESINIKLAIDAFWLDKAKSHDKARKAIQQFYSRVIYANEYFTSYKEGWKTDRGSIYIVYGQPTSVYTDEEVEIWNYGEPGNINNLKFVFTKKSNPYTTNHYQLERSTIYRNSWILSTENWQ